jgi:hypothetical protein
MVAYNGDGLMIDSKVYWCDVAETIDLDRKARGNQAFNAMGRILACSHRGWCSQYFVPLMLEAVNNSGCDGVKTFRLKRPHF